VAKKAKKRGVKPGTKRGPYKVLKLGEGLDLTEIDVIRNNLRNLVKLKIKYLQTLLRKI